METLEVVVTVSVHLIINDEEKERRKEELVSINHSEDKSSSGQHQRWQHKLPVAGTQ